MRNTETVHTLVTLDDEELELEVRGTFYPYRPATGPSWDCAGGRLEEAHFEIDSIQVGGAELSDAMEARIREGNDLEAMCLEEMSDGIH